MEKKDIILNKEQLKVVKSYNILHKLTFKFLAFIIAIILGYFLSQSLSSNKGDFSISQKSPLEMQKQMLIGQFNKLLSQEVTFQDLKIHVIQGTMNTTGGFVQSNNNLINLKGYTAPKDFFLYNTAPVVNISYFDNPNYDVNKLKDFVTNFVFTNKHLIAPTHVKRNALPLNNGLSNTFNLGCLFEAKIFNGVCNYYLDKFLEDFFVYNISMDYKGLEDIFFKVKDNDQFKQKFCETLNKYSLYSNDTNEKLENLFHECGGKQLQYFADLQGFFEIQKQLNGGYISKKTYNNKDLNNYKLLSYQQIIFNDIHHEKLNISHINTYIPFVQELLKKDVLDQFYKDEIYWYNNYFLKNELNKPKYAQQRNQSTDIKETINDIDTINHGNKLIGFTGLDEQISNHKLKVNTTSYVYQSEEQTEAESMMNLFKKVQDLSFLTILEQIVSANDVYIAGYINVNVDHKTIPLYVKVDLFPRGNSLVVSKIDIEGQENLTNVLNTAITKKLFTMATIHQFITDNIDLYKDANSQATLCDLINESIKGKYIETCTDERIILSRKIDKERISYMFYIDNYRIVNIEISNPKVQEELARVFTNVSTNKETIIPMLKNILFYNVNVTDLQEGTNESLTIFEKIQKYFNIRPTDITSKDGLYFIEFKIQGIVFIGQYNIQTHGLGPLYFKNAVVNDNPIRIRNFYIELIDDNKSEINKFAINPLEYIKSINKATYNAYENFINN